MIIRLYCEITLGVLYRTDIFLKGLKITKVSSEAVYRGRTNNTMDKLKKTKGKTIYNYGPLCREASRFVNLRGKQPTRVDKSGCFPTQRAVIVLLYFCQC